jgi:RimJ/RimL family protein N-acetyltransferase
MFRARRRRTVEAVVACTLGYRVRVPRVDFDRQPHLVGELLELRPLRPNDWDALFAVASDPLIWSLHPARDRYTEPVFREFFREALQSGGALVAIDRATGQIIGSSRYVWRDGDELEIGWSFLARAYWGGTYNREMKRLMLDYAFQFVDRVVFLVGVDNIRSRKALLKIGGVLTDRRVPVTLPGGPSESVVFEITKPSAAVR